MKKFLLSAAAATMVAAPMLAAVPAQAAQRHTTTVVKHKANGRTVIKQRKVVNKRPVYRTTYRTTYRPQHRNWARSHRPRWPHWPQVSGHRFPRQPLPLSITARLPVCRMRRSQAFPVTICRPFLPHSLAA